MKTFKCTAAAGLLHPLSSSRTLRAPRGEIDVSQEFSALARVLASSSRHVRGQVRWPIRHEFPLDCSHSTYFRRRLAVSAMFKPFLVERALAARKPTPPQLTGSHHPLRNVHDRIFRSILFVSGASGCMRSRCGLVYRCPTHNLVCSAA